MEYLAWFVFSVAVFQGINALINFLFPEKLQRGIIPEKKVVSVLIPARNEEENLAVLLSDLVALSEFDGEILIYNDQSTDNTAQIVRKFEQQDSRFRLIEGDDLPNGWLGKNRACHHLAMEAKGDYLLFLDADVRIAGDAIGQAVAQLIRLKLGLLSVFPKQLMLSNGEKWSVPLMNYILMSMLPLIWVRKSPFTAHSAANGQFMLYDAEVYRQIMPHEKLRANKVEDIASARLLKRNGIRIACLAGDERIRCRMYRNLPEAVSGFSKNIDAFFGHSYLITVLFGLFHAVGFLVILLALGLNLMWGYMVLMWLIRWLTSRVSEQPIQENLLYFPIQIIVLERIIAVSFINKFKKESIWKGRNIG